jgi:hypothetical protein
MARKIAGLVPRLTSRAMFDKPPNKLNIIDCIVQARKSLFFFDNVWTLSMLGEQLRGFPSSMTSEISDCYMKDGSTSAVFSSGSAP